MTSNEKNGNMKIPVVNTTWRRKLGIEFSFGQGCPAGRPAGRLTGRSTGRSARWPTGRSAGRLAGRGDIIRNEKILNN